MNAELLWTTAVRRVTQAAGPAAQHWLALHGLTTRPDVMWTAGGGAGRVRAIAVSIAQHGRLIEAGLAAGRDSDWLLHPGRGLRMREVFELAALFLAPDWNALRTRLQQERDRHDLALALNVVCKTLDIPLGATALDRLDLYAWKPAPGHWLLRKLARRPGAPGFWDRRMAGRRA